jgi:hypothetical protein
MATLLHPITHRMHLPLHHRDAETAASAWWHELLWIGAAAVLGFAISALFSGALELTRSWFVLSYAVVAAPFLIGYFLWSGIDLRGFVVHHWRWGLGGAVVFGAFVVMSVLRQDASARPEGVRLVWDLIWLGVVYGLIDALLLSVLPVLATWRALSTRGWTESLSGKFGIGALAIVASLVVTAAYHLGYVEYRDGDIVDPVFGNGIMSLGYVLTNNPITAVGSHIAMHVAAVLNGADTTVQLPPHY